MANAIHESAISGIHLADGVDHNIIVTGYSTNENGNTDYYTVKYKTVANVIASSEGGGGFSGGAIAGIAVGALIAGGIVSYVITRRRLAGR